MINGEHLFSFRTFFQKGNKSILNIVVFPEGVCIPHNSNNYFLDPPIISSDPCLLGDYRSNKCSSSHCIPCSVRLPSCTGKPDGIHAHKERPWTPYFITCYKQRTISTDVCPPDVDGRTQFFHMVLKECVPLDMVSQEHGGTMPNCSGKEDGSYLDDEGRCNQYTVCRNGAVENIVKCGEGKVFDVLKGDCVDYAKACRPCGGLENW